MSQTIRIYHPKCIYPGDEVIIKTLHIPEHKEAIQVQFHWGDDAIKVIGAHMVEPNIFEFPADSNDRDWYLKFCAKGNAKESKKSIYATVDIIRTNMLMVYFLKAIAIVLILFSILVAFNEISGYVNSSFKLTLSFFNFAVNIPIGIIAVLILWSSKVTEMIKRLATYKVENRLEYNSKTFSNDGLCITRRKNNGCCNEYSDNINNRDDYESNNISDISISFIEDSIKLSFIEKIKYWLCN